MKVFVKHVRICQHMKCKGCGIQQSGRNLVLYRPCIVINCIKSPTGCTFSCVFILKFTLCMFRTDTPFIVGSLRVTVYAAVCAYTVTRKLLMMSGVSVRNMQSVNFRINTYEKVHLVRLFIQKRKDLFR